MGLAGSALRMFGYDATEDRGRRTAPKRTTRHEDRIATRSKRDMLSATTRDLARNFSIVAWAIRKHLDYVATFTFQSKTGDTGYDRHLEQFVDRISAPGRFDIARRHDFRRAVRIAEACRIKDGDVFWLKLAPTGRNRGKIQAIEGDRVRSPGGGADPEDWYNGVRVNAAGAATAYAICDRGRGSDFQLKRVVSSRNMLHHACFDRYDQVRGISPIAAGLNWFRDTYEAYEYALAKAKIGQLFGLAFMREGMEGPFGSSQVTATQDADGDGVNDADFELSLPQGMFSLDLLPGEQAQVIESKTPSGETVNFLKLMCEVSLKSLDLPFSFYDESHTNFYGSRGGVLQYKKSCQAKIADLQQLQNNWLRWRLGLAVADGELELPSGAEFDFLKWSFVPSGVPWWDASKEARGAAMSIAMGVSNPQMECELVGTRFQENIDRTAEAMAYAASKGVPLAFADSGAFNPAINTGGAEDAAE